MCYPLHEAQFVPCDITLLVGRDLLVISVPVASVSLDFAVRRSLIALQMPIGAREAAAQRSRPDSTKPFRGMTNDEPLNNDISTTTLSRLSFEALQRRCDALGVRIEPSIDDQLAAIALRDDVDATKKRMLKKALRHRVVLAHEEIRHADEELRQAREGTNGDQEVASDGGAAWWPK